MQKVKTCFYWFCMVLVTILSGWVLWRLGLSFDYADNFLNLIQPDRLPFFVFGIGILGAVLLFFASRFLLGLKSAAQTGVGLALIILVLGIQLFFIIAFPTQLRGDHLRIFQGAMAIMKYKTLGGSDYNFYYQYCTNNIPFCLFTFFVLNLFKFLHIPMGGWMSGVRIVGILFFDFGILSSWYIVKNIRGQKAGIILLFMIFLNPMTYLLTAVYYTSTVSLGFAMAGLGLVVSGMKHKGYVRFFIAGLVLTGGILIRATALIPVVALVVVWCLYHRKWQYKKMGILTAGCVCMLLLNFLSYRIWVQADYSKSAMPAIHYIMMGAQGNGTFNELDATETQKTQGKEEKNALCRKKLLDRLQKMGPVGVLELFDRKLTVTFSDGTDDYISGFEGSLVSNSKISYKLGKYIYGSNRDMLVCYMHIYNTMMILYLFAAVIMAWGKKARKEDFLGFFLIVTILGAMVFHLIWECGEAYSIPYMMFFIMLSADGIMKCTQIPMPKIIEKRVMKFGAVGVCLIGILGACLWLYKGMRNVTLPKEEVLVSQVDYELDNLIVAEEIKQTFKADKPFNTISLISYNIHKEQNQAVYMAEIKDEDGDILYSEKLLGYLLPEEAVIELSFDTVTPKASGIYTLYITAIKQDLKCGIPFRYEDIDYYDLYQDGTLYIDGREQKNQDLNFSVFNRYL